MTTFFGVAAAAVVLLTIPFIGRVVKGPSIFDRVQALNGLGTMMPVLMILIGLIYGRVDMFVDLALAIYLLSLFTTLLIARYVREQAEGE